MTCKIMRAVVIGFVVAVAPVYAQSEVLLDEVPKGTRIKTVKWVDHGSAASVNVEAPYEFKVKGILKMIGLRYVAKPAEYTGLNHAVIGEQTYALIPAVAETQGRPLAQGSSSLSTTCLAKPPGAHLAFNVKTLAVLKRIVHREYECNGKDWYWKLAYEVDLHSGGSIVIPTPEQAAMLRENEGQTQGMQSGIASRAAALEEQARLAALDASRGQKSQIGSKICKVVSGVLYTGYTEAVSPDNGKLQIRVAAAHLKNAPNLSPGGFQPSIIWESSEAWELCD